ncbi:MAG TPA: M42 family metallopeptidase [Bacillota bacterium]|nr:M42 family metallopeptidase [Candidatus Fermentithermobacillaceae bacterium]HOB30226.1 M42 family metallopeptidase [Bacillota bacterium]HOK64165.1 M42 family metallopeptidase [Bacillota bacterium]HOL11674.1 M42 family metallopeptidase [Bacillota bacterium]HOQ02802.1 M42 family metallopeptidase [Bacillota bacterium]
MKELVKKFTEGFGPSGFEDSIREIIRKEVEPFVDEVRVDALGNLICFKKGNGGKKVLLDAHMDEIGVIITHIDENGFLRFGSIGGVNPIIALGQRVYFENGVCGVIGSERIEDPKDLKLEKFFIDIGAKSREQAAEKVKVGDAGAFLQTAIDLGDRMIAKAMDDRIGCVVIVEVLRQLKETKHDIYAVFATQEEVGLRGARVAAYGVEPDVGIAFDVTGTGDTPKARTMDVSIGKGAAIKVKDSSLICHPGLREYLVKLAEENGIPYQLEVLESGGTNAGAIQMTKAGIPAGVISIPSRYIHTPGEMVDLDDVKACIDLCVAACQSPLDF